MKHRLLSRIRGVENDWVLQVELQPQNLPELQALKNVQIHSASSTERELVDNYLLFEANQGLSILEVEPRNGRFFMRGISAPSLPIQ